MSRYPLEAAKTVRASERERAERRLTERERELQAARGGAQNAEAALRDFRRRAAERRASAPEPKNGAALQRERAFLDHLRAREAEHRRALAAARSREREAARAVREARAALGRAHAEEKVVERHEERWTAGRKRAAERAAEEELEEIRRA